MNDFDELHHRRRIEEVQAGNAAAGLAHGHHRGDGERRGVAHQDAVLGDDAFELLEQIDLGVEILDDGLDDQITVLERFEFVGEVDAAHDAVLVVLGDFLLGDELPEALVQLAGRLVRGTGRCLDGDDLKTGLSCDLHDAQAHCSKSYYSNFFDCHDSSSLLSLDPQCGFVVV